MKLQINGYSDAKEDEVGVEKAQYAGMDSKRVNAVMAYLMEKGIAENRLIASPQGSTETNPEITDTDEEDLKMAKNRRVTFKVR
jgi:OmpA-OmpF porin, OOP family